MKKKQSLKTFDILLLFVFLGVLTGYSMKVIDKNSGSHLSQKASHSIENISAQLLNSKLKNLQASKQKPRRNLASVSVEIENKSKIHDLGPEGIIGMDPWGQPFRYRFIKGKAGEYELLMVWSLGPDSRPAMNYRSLDSAQILKMLGAYRRDDDLGLIQKIASTPVESLPSVTETSSTFSRADEDTP